MFKLKIHPIVALFGAMALATSAPAFAQGSASTSAAPAASSAAPAASGAAAADSSAAPAADSSSTDAPATPAAGKLSLVTMVSGASIVVKMVMGGLAICSVISWTLLIIRSLEFSGLNRSSDRFLEAFRGARSITDMRRIATSEEFEGNPMADMAAAASEEVELSRQAGLQVSGAHRDSTIGRAQAAVSAVQASLAKRLSGGQQFLATVGSSGPFIGLFGTVYGIMTSFINITNSHTTNLSVVAPGIAEALLATAIGLFAAIPSVVFYNIFQNSISSYGARSEGFVAELLNAISRQLDKGA
jgi:biopolymer transport protein ExbB